MLHDVEFLRAKLSKIEGAGDVGEYLVGVVQAKHVDGGNAEEDKKAPGEASTATDGEKKGKPKGEEEGKNEEKEPVANDATAAPEK